jgi:hypothetical protein
MEHLRRWYGLHVGDRPLHPNAIEDCDDAHDDETDSCRNSCTYNVCGDGAPLLRVTEPYDDPDLGGPLTAARGGTNHYYHCYSAEDVEACLHPPELEQLPLSALELEQCDDGDLMDDKACVEADFDQDGWLECSLP